MLLLNEIHFDKNIWGDDANEFKPERFETINENDIRYSFIPFEIGPMACIGKKFSEIEMISMLCNSLIKFNFFITDKQKENTKENIVFTLKPNQVSINISLL